MTARSRSTSAGGNSDRRNMAARRARASGRSARTTCVYSFTQSVLVEALNWPPRRFISRASSRQPRPGTPLKRRCSAKWVMPPSAGASWRLPWTSQRLAETDRAPGIGWTRSRTPLSREVRWRFSDMRGRLREDGGRGASKGRGSPGGEPRCGFGLAKGYSALVRAGSSDSSSLRRTISKAISPPSLRLACTSQFSGTSPEISW